MRFESPDRFKPANENLREVADSELAQRVLAQLEARRTDREGYDAKLILMSIAERSKRPTETTEAKTIAIENAIIDMLARELVISRANEGVDAQAEAEAVVTDAGFFGDEYVTYLARKVMARAEPLRKENERSMRDRMVAAFFPGAKGDPRIHEPLDNMLTDSEEDPAEYERPDLG